MGAAKGQMVRAVSRLLNTPAPQKVTTSNVQALSAVLGSYEVLVQVDVDSYIQENTSALLTATPVTSATGHFIPAGAAWPLIVEPGNVIGAITSSGAAGSLFISTIG